MPKSGHTVWSTLGKKFFLALTGLSLFLFVCIHLAGNFLLFKGPEAFNTYSHKLMSLGGLLYVAEAILLAFFLVHMFTAVTVTLGNWKARPDRYSASASRGGPSRMTVSSKTMIWTGLVLLVFMVVHLKTFKYGPYYEVQLDGETVRDLYRVVAESFKSELYVLFYVVSMLLLGFHLRHGFWSAFQSLGGHHPRYTPIVYGIGVIAAIILGAGFLFIPIWFYFGGAA